MKKEILAVLVLLSSPALADELGTCSYGGRTVSDGIILNNCWSSGKSIANITLQDCIEQAQQALMTPEVCGRKLHNPFTRTTTEQDYMVHRKKVKYHFIGNESEIEVSGALKR